MSVDLLPPPRGESWRQLLNYLDVNFRRIADAIASIGSSEEGWHYIGTTGEPAFQNGWVNYGSVNGAAAYRKDSLGVVHLRGLIKNGTSTAAFQLPVGYRPAVNTSPIFCIIDGNNVAKYLQVDTNTTPGLVYIGGTGASYYSLEGVSFLAEQ